MRLLKIPSLLGLIILIIAGAAGGFLWWFGGRDLPEGIDRWIVDDDGRKTSFAGRYEGFTSDTLATGIISGSRKLQEGRRVAVLAKDLGYISYEFENNVPSKATIYVVPRYYITDFASIPWPASYLISPFGDHAEAAVIHDWLYAVGSGVDPSDSDYKGKVRRARLDADLTFYRAMRESGVPLWRRRIMFGAVRLGGGASFGADQEWYGADCDMVDDKGACLPSRFYEPFIGVAFPDGCLLERDPKLFRPAGRVSKRGVRINVEDEAAGVFAAMDILDYVDYLWRKPLSEDKCFAFFSKEMNTDRDFVAVKDPKIVIIDGPEEVVLAQKVLSNIVPPVREVIELPDELRRKIEPLMQRRLGYTEILTEPEPNDLARRLEEKSQLASTMYSTETAKLNGVYRVYDGLERRAEEILRLVPGTGLTPGNLTAKGRDELFMATSIYADQAYRTKTNIAEVDDRYFDDPVTLRLYRDTLNGEDEELFGRIEAILPPRRWE
ncbi:DUF1353 domain-containing protein [Parvularcula sp. ZS-1/3]|uniref:DUF1353 domain-containing protein n=1 Tax=Parvularcula mediterranea TaxID=2732508 RepID=A0A7Y3RJV1_9PROT|nr:DUF1353 domain-containing protein [Parvularcula mediterranea]NNU14712.1 DUF1353 domain-containing protein [Parvularcula mediterranea]